MSEAAPTDTEEGGEVPKCQKCGREFPNLPFAYRDQPVTCAECASKEGPRDP